MCGRSVTNHKRLLTREQVIDRLRKEVESDGLTVTAARYELAPQQVSDVLRGRANLSKRMAGKLAYVMHVLYERAGDK
jgi:hypothetical protein